MKKVIFLIGFLWAGVAAATEVYYSFVDGDEGGLAVLTWDASSGAVGEHRELFRSPEAVAVKKVAATVGGEYAIVVAVKSDAQNAFVVDRAGNVRTIDLEDETDEVRVVGGMAYVGADKGQLYEVDLAGARLSREINFRDLLSPSGRRVESIAPTADGRHAWISFQKDSRGGKHFGSRLVYLDLREMKVVQDLQLPRNRPELHYDLPKDRREMGPNPEVLVVSPETNTLFVTLDLYGAVAMMDLDAAERGEMRNLVYLPTSLDGSWGTAFPDRVGQFEVDGRKLLLVANVGLAGGAVVVDLAAREIIQRIPVRHGLTTLSFLPEHGLIIAGVEGKLKQRGPDGLTNEPFPGDELPIFRLTGEADAPLALEMVPMNGLVFQTVALPGGERPRCLISFGEGNPDTWLLFDLSTQKAVEAIPAFGNIVRTFRR